MVENARMAWGSKCGGWTWERRRKVPPRLGVCASAGAARPRSSACAVAPTARAAPPSFKRSRRLTEFSCSAMVSLLRREGRSAIEPGRHEAPAVVVADIWSEVLDVGFPRRHRAHRGAEQHPG